MYQVDTANLIENPGSYKGATGAGMPKRGGDSGTQVTWKQRTDTGVEAF